MMFNFKKEMPETVDPFYFKENYMDEVFIYEYHDNYISKVMLDDQTPCKNEMGGYHYLIYSVPNEKYSENMTPEELSEYASVAVLTSPFHYIKHLTSVGFSGKICMVTEEFLREMDSSLYELYCTMNSDDEDEQEENAE